MLIYRDMLYGMWSNMITIYPSNSWKWKRRILYFTFVSSHFCETLLLQFSLALFIYLIMFGIGFFLYPLKTVDV